MPSPSNSTQVYESNLSTFRVFRATIDDLKHHPWAPLGEQTSLVRRVQEWRKTIGHLTVWLQDVRAYYEQARPEIVSLLEFAFDSVSAVDQVRNDRTRNDMLRVTDPDFVNILRDYIRLIKISFSPERQSLYTTPADQDALQRGRILYNGLPTFHHRLETVQARRRSSVTQIAQSSSQPVSPNTPTHPLQPAQNTQPLMHRRTISGNHVAPIHPAQQQPGTSSMRAQTQPIPAGNMVPLRHPAHQQSQQPQVDFIHPHSNPITVSQITWLQPVTQQKPPEVISPNIQQAPSTASTNQAVLMPSAPIVPVESASATAPQDTDTTEPDLLWGLTWEELEALDRSEWDAGTANNDDLVNPGNGNVLQGSGPAAETSAAPDPTPSTKQQIDAQPVQLDKPPVPSAVGDRSLDQPVLTQSPVPITEKSLTPSVVAKEEAQSPVALLQTPPPPKVLNRLERRESLLAADVIDIEELSDDDSSVSQPLMASVGSRPPVATTSNIDVIDIDSDEEDELEPEPIQPQGDPSNEAQPPATSMYSTVSRPISDNQAPKSPAAAQSQPLVNTLALANDAIPNAGSATDHPLGGAQPIQGMSSVSPGDKSRSLSTGQLQPANVQGPPLSNKMTVALPDTNNKSPDMDVDKPTGKPAAVQASVQPPALTEDVEMTDGELAVAAPIGLSLSRTTSVNGGQVDAPLASIHSYESVKDAKEIPSTVLARIRKIAEEPLITWYIASDPSMSREVAKEKYGHMSDQEVFNLFLKVKPIIENLKTKVGAMTISTETPTNTPPLKDAAAPNQQNASLKRSQSPHTPGLAETGTSRKLARKITLPANIIPDTPLELPVLLCVLRGARGISKASLDFTVSTELMTSLKRWQARYLTPAGSHQELRTVELACYPPEAFYPASEGGSSVLTPNAQIRTWPNGGLLRAFINEGIRPKGQNAQLYLSPPPFTKINESLDLSEFVQEGKNTIRFLHLGGMENFVFVVQERKMSPPAATWSTVLKRVQEFTENPGYQALLTRLSEKIK